MKRTWIAVIAITLITLTSAAFVKEQFSYKTTAGEEVVSRPIRLNRTPNNFYRLSSGTEEEDRYTEFLAASKKGIWLPGLLSTGAAQWSRAPVCGEQRQERVVAEEAPYTPIVAAAQIYTPADSNTSAYTDRYLTCVEEDSYDEGEITCYVDSVNGDDANNGLSEATPVKSQSAIDSSCTVVRFKRGSFFNEKLAIPTYFNGVRFVSNRKVFTNYGPKSDPLPHFKVSSEPGRGPVILSWAPLTIDGLHLSGARGDNTMEHDFDFDGDGITKGIVGGIGAFLGAATIFINNEIDDCDIGIMLGGPGSVVRGNYVHDLIMGIDDDPGVDPNLVGGAEGIFVNASNCEVSYNRFINCTGPARWVGSHGECDGGATEVSAASGGTIENVHIHHNFSYNSCGFFEVASYFGEEGKGVFKNSSLHNNLIVDSAWMGLLQVNNTDLENIHFYNNTLIQRPGSLNEGILWIIFTAESSGMEGGELVPGTVFLTNNLYVLHGVASPYSSWFPLIDPAFETSSNILASYSGPEDPNYIDLGFANIEGTEAQDFDLVDPESPAVDTGAYRADNTLDYFNRSRPTGSAADIGALEFGSGQAECIPRFPAISIRPISDPFRPAIQRRRPVERTSQR
jgi:hypothetical protein